MPATMLGRLDGEGQKQSRKTIDANWGGIESGLCGSLCGAGFSRCGDLGCAVKPSVAAKSSSIG